MADLRPRERGQIILIAAFALAVTFVALALIVNSAIFTENLTSRGETGGSDDALEVRAMVERSVGESIRGANIHNTSSQSALDGGVEDGIDRSQLQLELQQVTDGALVEVTLVTSGTSPTYGSRVVQNESGGRAFVDSDGPGAGDAGDEWQVFTQVDRMSADHGTRAFEMNVSELPGSAPGFVVRANGTNGNPKWRMNVYGDLDSSVGDNFVEITVDPPGAPSETCRISVSRTYAHIDVTGGTVAGEPCDALQQGYTDSDGFTVHDGRFARGVSDEYNITFENGDAVVGNYSFVTTNTSAPTTSATLNTTAGDSPYVTNAIYNVSVQFEFETAEVKYETRIRVAPGEPDA